MILRPSKEFCTLPVSYTHLRFTDSFSLFLIYCSNYKSLTQPRVNVLCRGENLKNFKIFCSLQLHLKLSKFKIHEKKISGIACNYVSALLIHAVVCYQYGLVISMFIQLRAWNNTWQSAAICVCLYIWNAYIKYSTFWPCWSSVTSQKFA